MSSLPKHIEDNLQSFLEILVLNAILSRCLHVEHEEEQHLKGDLDLNVWTTSSIHVNVNIKQGSRSRLGFGSNAHKEGLIRSKELKNRRNSNLNVKAPHLVHVKLKIK
jgi:hypothetical protein